MKAIIQSAVAVFITFATLFGLAYVGVTSANNSDLEPLSAIERYIVNETIYPDGKVVEINELTKLVKSQLIVDSASSADLPFNSSTASFVSLKSF